MAMYRYQVVSVGWWRGKIKRWNTTFHVASAGYQNSLRTAMSNCGWPNPGDVLGDCSGGIASIATYADTGGAPINNTVYFDWQTPSTWIPYAGTSWVGVDPATPLDAAGESAAVILGRLPGLSRTGKPVFTRKFLHAVPSRTSADFSAPDITTATAAQLAGQFPALFMASPSGVQPATVSCDVWYGNHQRVRGRRRTVASVAANSFSAGVVAGSQTSGAAPFPGS